MVVERLETLVASLHVLTRLEIAASSWRFFDLVDRRQGQEAKIGALEGWKIR